MADNKQQARQVQPEPRIIPHTDPPVDEDEILWTGKIDPLMAVATAVGRVGMGEMTMANVRNTISLVLPASKDEGQKFVDGMTKMLQVMEAARNFTTEEFWARNR